MSPRFWITVTVVASFSGLFALKFQRVSAPVPVVPPVAPMTPAPAGPSAAEEPRRIAAVDEPVATDAESVWLESKPASDDPALLGEWARLGEARLVSDLRAQVAAPLPGTFPLALGPGRDFEVEVARVEQLNEREGVVVGRISGRPDSTAVLSYVGDAAAGTVHLPNSRRALNLYRTEDGLLRVIEIDLARAPECGGAIAVANH